MRFISIQLKNYRQYETLDFAFVDGENKFCVVQGDMGRGKTTFTNAIIWCLYGVEGAPAPEPLVNSGAIYRAKDSQECVVGVVLKVELDDGSIANIKREQPFARGDGRGLPTAKSHVTVVHSKDTRVGADPVKDAQAWVEKVFPKRLHPYFIFNGERAADHFEHHTKTEVRDAILGIARVDVLQRMKAHLERVQDDIRADAKRADPGGLSEADSKLETIRAKIVELDDKILQLEESLNDFDLKNSDLRSRLEKSGALREQLIERDQASDKVRDASNELFENVEKLSRWAGLAAPLAFAEKALAEMTATVAASKKAGTFPPDFQASALKRLLDGDECICGRHLDDDNARSRVQELLDEFKVAGPRGEELQRLDKELARFSERNLQCVREYRELIAIRTAISEDLEEANSNLVRLNSEVGDVDRTEDIALWEELNELQNRRRDKEVDLTLMRAERDTCKKDEENALAAYMRLASQSVAARKLASQLVFLDEAIASIDAIYRTIVERVRANLGQHLKDNYAKWHSKQNTSDEIVLTEDFNIQKLNQFGHQTSFSMGEYRLLYYSLCLALRGVSGYQFPLLIDSPWGNMGVTSRKRLAEAVSSQAGDFQTTLFVLDSEFTPEIASICLKAKPKLYQIEMSESDGTKASVIQEVGA